MKISTTQIKFNKILIVLFWILLWEIAALIIDREIYLPSPFSTLKALYLLFFDKSTYITILYSSFRTLSGFILSCFFGIILGYFCGINKFIYELFNPLIRVIRTIPVMSVIILVLFWFKDTNGPIFVAFLMCFPIIWTNTVMGIKNTDVKLLQMCKVYNIKKWRIIKSIYLYSSLPYIKAGMISSLGIGWKVTSAAEVLSLPKYSIGRFLYDSKVYLEMPELFAWTIIIIGLSFLFEKTLIMIFKEGN